MGVKKVIKKGLTFGFQPKRWIGFGQIKKDGKVCADLVNGFLAKEKSPSQLKQEAEEDRQSSRMSDAELQSRKKLALGLVAFYLLLSFGLFCYMGYLWFSKSLILPGCMSFIVGLLVIVYALREFIIFGQIHFDRKRLSLTQLLRLLLKLK